MSGPSIPRQDSKLISRCNKSSKPWTTLLSLCPSGTPSPHTRLGPCTPPCPHTRASYKLRSVAYLPNAPLSFVWWPQLLYPHTLKQTPFLPSTFCSSFSLSLSFHLSGPPSLSLPHQSPHTHRPSPLPSMSALQDVLVTEASPSPRLLSPGLSLHPSARSFSAASAAIICRAITSCADLSRALLLLIPEIGSYRRGGGVAAAAAAAALAEAGESWGVARRELLRARGDAVGQYWTSVVQATTVRVARNSQVGGWLCRPHV